MNQDDFPGLYRFFGHVAGVCFILTLACFLWFVYSFIFVQANVAVGVLLLITGSVAYYLGAVSRRLVKPDASYSSLPRPYYLIGSYLFLTLGLAGLIILMMTYISTTQHQINPFLLLSGSLGAFVLAWLCKEGSRKE